MNREKFLTRIGLNGKRITADLESLKILQRQHLLTVPFENLDIHWGREITLDLQRFYEKIVERKRGGFCYELNGNFNELLKDIGFQTKIVSARVAIADDKYSPEYSHLAIIAKIDDSEYLVDVGFGDFTAEPLEIVSDIEQADQNGSFEIRIFENCFSDVRKRIDGVFVSRYMFQNLERKLPEFAGMCHFQQTSPESHFTKGKLCSRMTEYGRISLTDKNFIVTIKGEKHENDVETENEFEAILEREFGISNR